MTKKKTDNPLAQNYDKWLKGMNFVERDFLIKFAEDYYKPVIDTMDKCITAAMFTIYEDASFDEVYRLQDMYLEMCRDQTGIDTRLKKMGVDVMKKLTKELEATVKARAEELIKEGKNQKESIDTLYFEFTNLSRAEVTNAYKHVKADMRVVTINEVAEAKNESNESVEMENKEIEKDYKEAFDETKELENAYKGTKEAGNLKVLTYYIKAAGKFGEYLKSEKGVSFDDKNFSDETELEKWRIKECAIIANQLQELQERMNGINGRVEEASQMFNM